MKVPLPIRRVVRRNKPVGEGWQNESIYGAWNRHCIANDVQTGIEFPLDKVIAGRRLFSPLVPEEAEKLASEMLLTVEEVTRLQGADMGKHNSLVINLALRYCQKCIDLNYHSAVYQHIALARCPLHTTAFHDVCHRCHMPVIPTFSSVIEHPFECPNCKCALGRTAKRDSDTFEAISVDTMIGERRRVLATTVSSRTWSFAMSSNLKERLGTPSNPVASRHFQRMCVWQKDRSTAHWPVFKEQHFMVTGKFDSLSSRVEVNAALSVLLWLRQVCYAHELSAVTLAHRLGRYPRGLRINTHTSLISAAMYKLASAYGLVQDMVTFFELDAIDLPQALETQTTKTVARYAASAFREPELDFRLMQFEMLGMFAKLLLMHRHEAATTEVNWMELPNDLEFGPTWLQVTEPGQQYHYLIRPRVTEESLRRLIARKWNHQLVFEFSTPESEMDFWKHTRLEPLSRTARTAPAAPMRASEFSLSNPKLREIHSLEQVFGQGQQIGRNFIGSTFHQIPDGTSLPDRGSRIESGFQEDRL